MPTIGSTAVSALARGPQCNKARRKISERDLIVDSGFVQKQIDIDVVLQDLRTGNQFQNRRLVLSKKITFGQRNPCFCSRHCVGKGANAS